MSVRGESSPAHPDRPKNSYAWGRGETAAFEQLVPLVHEELRRLARWHMARERRDHTLQASALVNEAYLRLIDLRRMKWQDRAHFFAMSGRVMRRILVSISLAPNGTRSGAETPPGSRWTRCCSRQSRPAVTSWRSMTPCTRSRPLTPRKSDVVEMRYFGGLSLEETAETLCTYRSTR